MAFRDDEYEKDPVSEDLDSIYKKMDIDKMVHEADYELTEEEKDDIEFMFWEDEARDLLENIGCSISINLDSVPRDRLKRMFERYDDASVIYDEKGNDINNDPLEHYHIEGNSKKGLYNLGYELGLIGELGMYYRLLPLIEFSRGYWKGLLEKGRKENDQNIISLITEEIRVYDPSKVQEELELLKQPIEEDGKRKIKGF